MDWLARFPDVGGRKLEVEPFGPPELNLVVGSMEDFFLYGCRYLEERGHKVTHNDRMVEDVGPT